MTGRERSVAHGFTYVELLIALGIFSVVLLAMIPPLVAGSGNAARARSLAVAAQVANERIDELRSQDFAAMASGSDQIRVAQAAFGRAWTVQLDAPHPGLATLSVTVTPLPKDLRRPSAAVTLWCLRAR